MVGYRRPEPTSSVLIVLREDEYDNARFRTPAEPDQAVDHWPRSRDARRAVLLHSESQTRAEISPQRGARCYRLRAATSSAPWRALAPLQLCDVHVVLGFAPALAGTCGGCAGRRNPSQT